MKATSQFFIYARSKKVPTGMGQIRIYLQEGSCNDCIRECYIHCSNFKRLFMACTGCILHRRVSPQTDSPKVSVSLPGPEK